MTPHAGGARPPLGSGGPSRSESAVDWYSEWQRAVAWNRVRIETFPSATRETAEERRIAYARDLYVRDVIDLPELERRIADALAA